MITPDELRRWAKAKLPDCIDAAMRGETVFPLEHTRFGRADRAASTAEIDAQVRALIGEAAEVVSDELPALARARQLRRGYSVRFVVHRLRGHGGEQALPNRVWFETWEDFLAFTGETARWSALQNDIEKIATAGSVFGDWAREHARDLRARLKVGEGAALAEALTALHAKPQPGCFAREIALPGISGKFIEENLGLIADILRATGSPAWRDGGSLHDQLGLRQTSRLLRVMILDGARCDYGVPIARFDRLPTGMGRVLIVENLRTFLTLPTLPEVLAIFGEGNAVQTLAGLDWLAGVPMLYWGDLDPTGFDILARLRAKHPHLRSLLMDEETRELYCSLLSPAFQVRFPSFEILNESERKAADWQ